MIKQMTVVELKKKLDDGEPILLLDVREQKEFDIARIPGSKLMPLSTLAQQLEQLEDCKEKEIVVHCKLGGRSQQACQLLEAQGFKNLANLSGGISAWTDQIDPSLARY